MKRSIKGVIAAPYHIVVSMFDLFPLQTNGDYKAVHCMEIPFVMNNIARCEEMTGGGKDAYALADKMSQSWINFARTGNPNHKGLPNWPKYKLTVGATMMFDNTSTVRNHPDKEYLEVISSTPPRL